MSRIDRVLLVIVAVALLLRLGWGLRLSPEPSTLLTLPDQREYVELARNFSSGEGLRFFDARFDDNVYAYRTPGYPLLIAACGNSLRIVRLVQAVMDSGTVVAAYLLTMRLIDRRGAARLAAIGIALNPFLIYFTGLLLSETLYTALLAWGMVLLLARSRLDRWLWWIGGMLLAVSVLVRPGAIGLPVVLGLVSALVNRHWPQPYDLRWAPPVGATMLALTLAALTPWALRNHRVLGEWVLTSTNGGITLYDGNHPDATGASDQRFVAQLPQLKLMSESARSRYLSTLAWQFMREQPSRALTLAAIKIARLWSPVPLSNDYGSDRRLVTVALLYTIPLYLLLILTIAIAPLPASIKAYCFTPALYLTIVHALTIGSLRYRIPADVPLIVLAAIGVHMGWLSLRKREAEPVAVSEAS